MHHTWHRTWHHLVFQGVFHDFQQLLKESHIITSVKNQGQSNKSKKSHTHSPFGGLDGNWFGVILIGEKILSGCQILTTWHLYL